MTRLLADLEQITFVGVLGPGETRYLKPAEEWADPIEMPTSELASPPHEDDGWPARGFRILSGAAQVLLIADEEVYFTSPFSCRLGAVERTSYPIRGLYIHPRTRLRLQAHNPTEDRTAVAFQLLRRSHHV